jgi:membrane associated rhomboid family serine protease
VFLFLPFRAKNPPNQFPWVTVGLIVANVLAYALTTESFLIVSRPALEMFGFSHNNLTPIRLITHMFLHANLTHLLGNMLFLWVFGGAVEGRIGSFFFLPMYLLAGMAAGVTHDSVNGRLYPDMWCIGASGAIMSLLGAYLWLSPYARILVAYVVGWGIRLHAGVTTWEARWLVLGYAIVDLVEGYFFRDIGGGGTANFAHLGGMAAGFLIARLSRMEQETAQFAESQAIRSDFGNHLQVMQIYELEPLVNGPQLRWMRYTTTQIALWNRRMGRNSQPMC